MFEDFDTEERYRLATGALEALTSMVEGQRPHEGIDTDKLAPLLRVVTETVKWAMPDGRAPSYPIPQND